MNVLKLKSSPRTDSPWMSTQDAADYLGISVDTLYRAIQTKGLKHSKIGHSLIRFRREWLDAWVESKARVS